MRRMQAPVEDQRAASNMNWALSWQDAAQLGRVTGLPTVWTNMLAGLIVAGGSLFELRSLLLFFALTFIYLGGACLYDAFDATANSDKHPQRPIPAGRIGRPLVFTCGFVFFALAFVPLYPVGFFMDPVDYVGVNYWPLICGGILIAAVLLYDWRHQHNLWGPAVLGTCRSLVYLTAGLAFMVPPMPTLLVGAAMLFCYALGVGYLTRRDGEPASATPWPFYLFLAAPLIYGLGLVAQRPHILLFWIGFAAAIAIALWLMHRDEERDRPRAALILASGIALYDALLIAGTGALGFAALALLGFVAALVLPTLLPEP